MEKLPYNPEEAARRVVDQAKDQYDEGKIKRFRYEVMKQLEKKEKSTEGAKKNQPINIVFDGPPGPEAGRFVEVEDDSGKSIAVGKWLRGSEGFWILRIESLPKNEAA